MEPKLDKPGAGLPFPQNLVVRYILGPSLSRKNSWEKNAEVFELETQKIQGLVKQFRASDLNKKTLVPKMRGIEDSSRFWSPVMTLEHMLIVGKNIGNVVIQLSQENVPNQKVDIAAVKPHSEPEQERILQEFSQFHSLAHKVLTQVKNREARSSLLHPWFGPFTAQQWFWLLGVHQGIHRNQLRKIKELLDR